MKNTLERRGSLAIENIGKFHMANRTVLIPAMNRIGAPLMAAVFRSFSIPARVLDTFEGMDLGRAFTSGKECFPCQVTLGDILHYLKNEKERQGAAFDPERYVYFLPESDGPCRFGVYNKYQRLVLDSFPGMERLKICALTTVDGYSLAGMIEKDKVADFRKAAYWSVVVTDILERLLWRIRPYERKHGAADAFIDSGLQLMECAFEEYGSSLAFGRILDRLETIVGNSRHIFDPEKPRKPRIGMVGEIFLRMHTQSNRDLIRTLECYGAEVVNASFAEWVNFVGYTALRDTRKKMKTAVRQLRFINAGSCFKKLIGFGVDFAYQETVLKRIYKRVHKHIDLAADHRIANIEHRLREEDLFSFDIGTEACLSIGTALEYIRHGYDGIVNVYPFACMPGMTTSAVLKPILRDFGLPYLDVPCDSGVHPGRETAIRTFMHQAFQHRKNGCCSQAAAAASGDLEMRAAEMRRHLPSI